MGKVGKKGKVLKMTRKKARKGYARLDPFARGQVVALYQVGTPLKDIAGMVAKKDGKRPSQRVVVAVLEKGPERPLICAGQVRRRGPAPGELQSPVANLLTRLGYGTIASLFASY